MLRARNARQTLARGAAQAFVRGWPQGRTEISHQSAKDWNGSRLCRRSRKIPLALVAVRRFGSRHVRANVAVLHEGGVKCRGQGVNLVLSVAKSRGMGSYATIRRKKSILLNTSRWRATARPATGASCRDAKPRRIRSSWGLSILRHGDMRFNDEKRQKTKMQELRML